MKNTYGSQQGDAWLRNRIGRITGSRIADVCSYLSRNSGDKKVGDPSGKRDDYRLELIFERLCGRAAELLTSDLPQKPPEEFADKPCGNSLLRGRHVHVAPGGMVMPGTCAGIVLGRIGPDCSASRLWQSLTDDPQSRPILAALPRPAVQSNPKATRSQVSAPNCSGARRTIRPPRRR